ncbi:MAG: MopE-related protein [Pseudomonadota bacterium]
MNTRHLLLPLLLMACEDEPDTGALDSEPVVIDADADGFDEETDCDDADPAINPDARERCDGVDNDCDGIVDEDDATDAATWHADADGDGFGDAGSTRRACAQPSGHVQDTTDCDDQDAAVHPGADEICNGVDDDCDGLTDPDASSDAPTWYTDGDADGYGDPDNSSRSCAQPGGTVADGDDCDDGDPGVHPGAEETCDEVDQDCDGAVDEDATDLTRSWADLDGDGYGDPAAASWDCEPTGVDNADDCDDSDAGVHPEAEETCDGVDQDCDGLVDDEASDAPAWYDDLDGDGYGDASVWTYACSAPANTSADPSDCDDRDATVSPDGTEVCGGGDEDCDGAVDDDDDDVAPPTFTVAYEDADGDGWGAADASACVPASGTVPDGGDCDDSDATFYPGAYEPCDGLDHDCDGVADSGTHAGDPWYLDADGDGYGASASSVYGCAQPTGYVEVSGDCDDGDATISPGADELCWNGVDDDCDGLDDTDTDCAPEGTLDDGDADHSLGGSMANEYFGAAIAAAGDLDGDGYPGLLIGAPGADSVEYFDGPGGWTTSTADVSLIGETTGDDFGRTVAAGDLDGDGVDELIVGAPNAGSYGKVYVYDATGTELTVWSGSDGTIGDGVLVVGDLDGDGVDELLIGAPSAGIGGVIYGVYHTTGEHSVEDADWHIVGEHPGDDAGASVSFAGDVNGDGEIDLVIGAPGNAWNGTDGGAAYLLYGPVDPSVACLVQADVRLYGGDGDEAGTAVAGAGDLDADGYDDVVVGAPGWDSASSGAGGVAVLWGPVPPARFDLDDFDWIDGVTRSEEAGAALASLDLDGDGWPELAVAAPLSDDDGTDAGRVAVLYGPVTTDTLGDATLTLYGDTGDRLGSVLVSAGDLDGDGYEDLAVGQPYNGSSDTGAVAVLLGGSREAATASPTTVSLVDDADGDGWTEADGDCDDTRADQAPDLTEICDDGLDNDCDGRDQRCPTPSGYQDATTVAGFVTYGDSSYTSVQHGDEVVAIGDFDGDGHGDYAFADSWYSGNRGRIELRYGPLGDGVETAASADLVITGEYSGDNAGATLAAAGDVDGDGTDDLLVGAPYYGFSPTDAGRAYLLYGGERQTGSLSLASADVILTGVNQDDELGTVMVGLGDLDGDGVDEFAVGMSSWDGAGTNSGALLVYRGPFSAALGPEDAWLRIEGSYASDGAGGSVAPAGDLDGDGEPDLLVVAGGAAAPWMEAGRALVYFGPFSSGTLGLMDAGAQVWSTSSSYSVGRVGGPFDLDGDGWHDLVVGDPVGGSGGHVSIWFGPIAPGEYEMTAADLVLTGDGGDELGSELAGGDLNGDGLTDLLVGTPDHGAGYGAYDGAVYLFYGPLSAGALDATAADVVWEGWARAELGLSIAAADVDEDGFDDAIIGTANGSWPDGPSYTGYAAVMYGGLDTSLTWTSVPEQDPTADTDGDGTSPADGDCDDSDPDVGPSEVEVCGNGVDDDCSGGDQPCGPSGSYLVEDEADLVLYGRTSSEGAGSALAFDDLDGDGVADLVVGLHSATDGASSGGAVAIVPGPLDVGVFPLDDAIRIYSTTSRDYAGYSVGAGGDVDGDGVRDVVLGGYYNAGGTAWLIPGTTDESAPLSHVATVTLSGSTTGDAFGKCVGIVPDFDGDGLDEIFVGGEGADGGGSDAGAAWLFLGPVTASSAADADLILDGVADDDGVQAVASAGDCDGDGLPDLLVGASGNDDAGSGAGCAYLWSSADGLGHYGLDSAYGRYPGSTGQAAGGGVAGAGDVDGDGWDEVLVGGGSASFLLYGPLTGGTVALSSADVEFSSGSWSGPTVRSAGDVDGDGLQDLLLGATSDSTAGRSAGAAWPALGPVSTGFYDLDYADASFIGDGSYDYLGWSVGGGDVTGDGYSDVALGALGASWSSSSGGVVYLFRGGPEAE